MTPWIELDVAPIPNNGGELILSQRGNEFSISLKGKRGELMNSRVYHSEKQLSKLGCAYLRETDNAKVLIGGLGMGYTLASALNILKNSAEVTVAELVPEVVEWNQGPLGACAKYPLQDTRTQVHVGDVKDLLTSNEPTYDAILLDVDNGPRGLTHSDNNWLYSEEGLNSINDNLRPQGMLAVWSAGPDYLFSVRLKNIGFDVITHIVHSRGGKKGDEHSIFLARKTQ
ncbi:hypothetical protein QX776_09560 [Alteromonadaceae bacterium BrNp21-10]|nr:hypothetical protein [Alteromonadaceae bacterium BrNp21-10]